MLAYVDWTAVLPSALALLALIALLLGALAAIVGPTPTSAVALPSAAAFVGGALAAGSRPVALAVAVGAALAAAAGQRLLLLDDTREPTRTRLMRRSGASCSDVSGLWR